MKKIFLYGRLMRLFSIFSFIFLIYGMIDMTVTSGFQIKYIMFTVIVLFFVIIDMIWIYSLGIVFDFKKNKFKLILGLLNKNKYERILNNISSIDIVNDLNLGAEFIIDYLDGSKEKIYYHFYRVSFIEELLFKRLKRQLNKINIR